MPVLFMFFQLSSSLEAASTDVTLMRHSSMIYDTMRTECSSMSKHFRAIRTFVTFGDLRFRPFIPVRMMFGKMSINFFPGIEMFVASITGQYLQHRYSFRRREFRRFRIVKMQHMQVATRLLQKYSWAKRALKALVRVAWGVLVVVALDVIVQPGLHRELGSAFFARERKIQRVEASMGPQRICLGKLLRTELTRIDHGLFRVFLTNVVLVAFTVNTA